MMTRFCQYIDKVFDFANEVAALRDTRPRPQIPTGAIWASAFFMCVMRRGSLNAIEADLRTPKRLDRFIGPRKPSADRISDVSCLIAPHQLRGMLKRMNHRLRRNKALPAPWHLRFAAVDGHEIFSQ